MKTSQERSQVRQRRLRTAGAGLGIVLLSAFVVALSILPWSMGIVAEAQRAYVEQIPEGTPGAYVLTKQGAMPLYEWYMPMAKLPPDAAALAARSLRSLVIVSRRFQAPQVYILYSLGTQQPVGWHAVHHQGRQLFLEPPSLGPGDYLLIVPTEDVFGGNIYYYFRLY